VLIVVGERFKEILSINFLKSYSHLLLQLAIVQVSS